MNIFKPNFLATLLFLLCISVSSLAQSASNQVGFWWQPSNPTWGLSIQQQGSHTFAVWFTYNAQGKPTWYGLSCDFVQNQCAGELMTGNGTPQPNITAGANAQFKKFGNATLSLTGNTLNLNYSKTGDAAIQQLTGLERLNLATGGEIPTCSLQAGNRTSASNYTDLWWGGADAGWGLHITQQVKQLFLSWVSYDAQGDASWLYGLGTQVANDSKQFSGQLYQFDSNTPFSQLPASSNSKQLGSFSLLFSHGEQGTLSYSLPQYSVNNRIHTLQRVVFPGNDPVNVCSSSSVTSAQQEAARFLAQATFGAKMADIEALSTNHDYAAWLEQQFAKQQTLYLPSIEKYWLGLPVAQQRGTNPATVWTLWKNFSTADDQLRQRIIFALSEIMVISLDSQIKNFPLGPAQYLDTLGAHAFGNYRDLLEAVTYSPMMGAYLSSLRNRKEDVKTGRVPDENYAREIMQLFSIGLYKLNLDGSLVLDSNNKPIETYSNADITGLAKVFTGLSWAGPDTSNQRFLSQRAQGLDNEVKPMQAYNQYHSLAEKRFLNMTIPEQKTADTVGDIRIALDALFNHPNVGPFIGKQLIQRLVTSNPSPAYIARVASVFNNNGLGIRGDLRAVIKAILLDDEARTPPANKTQFGKLREPVLRFVQWLRAFNAKSASGQFLLGNTARPDTQLGQSPLLAPSVFNFFRPNYVPPNSKAGDAGMLVPEAQITTETSVAGYLNFMRNAINNGVGTKTNTINDIQADYTAELALAADPRQLVERVSLLLATQLSANRRQLIEEAIASVKLTEANKLNRVKLAIYLVMATPEYIVQD